MITHGLRGSPHGSISSHRKATPSKVFRNFVTMVEKEFPSTVSCVCLRTDRGSEYLSGLFNAYLATKGIQRQLTVAGIPYQNGVAERKNRTLLETARTWHISLSSLSCTLWQEAVKTVNYVWNRYGTRSLYLSSPYEALTSLKPNISHFRVIGSTSFIFVSKENWGGGGNYYPPTIVQYSLAMTNTQRAIVFMIPFVAPSSSLIKFTSLSISWANLRLNIPTSQMFLLLCLALMVSLSSLKQNYPIRTMPTFVVLISSILLHFPNYNLMQTTTSTLLLLNLHLHHQLLISILPVFDVLHRKINFTIERMTSHLWMNLLNLCVTK